MFNKTYNKKYKLKIFIKNLHVVEKKSEEYNRANKEPPMAMPTYH